MSDAVMVPRVPTEAMIEAGERAAWDDNNSMPAISAMRKAWSAMLAASTPVGGWEPIDALPEAMKDGVTRFLVSYTDGVVRACRWLDNSKTDWPWKGVSPTEQIPMRADARMTHWMPLPPPPSVSIDNGSRPQEAVPTEQAEPAVVEPTEAMRDGQSAAFYRVKAAIERAMQDERDGKPCGCIIEAGCEARSYGDPEYAASGFIWDAAQAALIAATPQPTDGCSSNEGAA